MGMTEAQYLTIIGTIWIAPRCGMFGFVAGIIILTAACLKGLGVLT
jgi:hypothetical protein